MVSAEPEGTNAQWCARMYFLLKKCMLVLYIRFWNTASARRTKVLLVLALPLCMTPLPFLFFIGETPTFLPTSRRWCCKPRC